MASIPYKNATTESSLRVVPQPPAEPAADKHSYGQILKSSALVGGSTVLNIAIGVVRTKAMAVLLGPAGFGLAGLYLSISNLAQSVAGMGINSSGVRQIAEAVGTDDAARIARTSAVLRRTAVVLGLLGALLLIVFSSQISVATFGNTHRTGAICLLSLAVFFRLVSDGQSALIQGMRRIADLAKVAVVGASLGALVSIPLVYFLRERGVVPSLVAVAAMSLLASWWYSRRIQTTTYSATPSEVAQEAKALLKLGFAFMASGLMMMGSAYWVRVLLLRNSGAEATGFYQAAWTLGGLYVGIILQAMGADFYPRLTASVNDHVVCNRLVNEQTRVGLLLAGPGVIATLTFAPVVVALLYSAKFAGAVAVLRWICLGTMLQVITWPMGFIIVAKGRQQLFFWCELAWTAVYVGLAWLCVKSLGLTGAGLSFLLSYVFHAALIYPIVRGLTSFRWSDENLRTILVFVSLVGLVFCAEYVMPFRFAAALGVVALLLSTGYSIRVLVEITDTGAWERIPRPMRRLLAAVGVSRPSEVAAEN